MRLSDLKIKEVIGINNGNRFGYVCDAELDQLTGQVRGLVIPGRLKLFGLLGREKPTVIPWQAVRQFGEDTLLVDLERIGPIEREKPVESALWQEK